MSTLRKMLEEKKANILADAQRRAAEVDKDMEELERLTAKYGLSVIEPPSGPVNTQIKLGPGNAQVRVSGRSLPETIEITATSWKEVFERVRDTLAALADASITARARAGAEAYIRAKNRPALLSEIYDALEAQGVKFHSENPKNTLSAVLGQSSNLYSISRDKGWWLQGVPVPEEPNLLRRI